MAVSKHLLASPLPPTQLCTASPLLLYLQSGVFLSSIVLPSRRPCCFMAGFERSASVEIRCHRESEKRSTQLATPRGSHTKLSPRGLPKRCSTPPNNQQLQEFSFFFLHFAKRQEAPQTKVREINTRLGRTRGWRSGGGGGVNKAVAAGG